MDKNEENLIQNLKKIRLEEGEKNALRTRLLSEINETSVHSPYAPRWSIFSYKINFSRKLATTLACLVLIVTCGSVTFAAAESSLPGDALYGVKTKVNEPILRVITATTPEKAIRFETNLLEKRLEEAETLDQKGNLGEINTDKVKAELTVQTARLEKALKKLSDREEKKNKKEEVKTIQTITEKEKSEEEQKMDKKAKNDVAERINKVFTKHQKVIEKIEKRALENLETKNKQNRKKD